MLGFIAIAIIEAGATLGVVHSQAVERRQAFLRLGKTPRHKIPGTHQAVTQLRRNVRPLTKYENFLIKHGLFAIRWVINSDTAEEITKLAVASGPPLGMATLKRQRPAIRVLSP